MTINFTVKLRILTSWLQKIQLCELANAWTYFKYTNKKIQLYNLQLSGALCPNDLNRVDMAELDYKIDKCHTLLKTTPKYLIFLYYEYLVFFLFYSNMRTVIYFEICFFLVVRQQTGGW